MAEASELEAVLRTLERVARNGQWPSRQLAREVLLALGAWMRESGSDATPLERVRKAGRALSTRWDEVVRAELSLSCAEFVQSVDPRYLGIPNYDRDYTRAARARLEDRLRAAGALGFALDAKEVEMLALADQVWSAHLQGTAADGSPPPRAGEPAVQQEKTSSKNRSLN